MPVTTGPFPVFLPGVVPDGGGSVAVSDDFNRENSTSIGSNWTYMTEYSLLNYNLGILSSAANWRSITGTGYTGVYWNADQVSANCYSELSAIGNITELFARYDTTNKTGYNVSPSVSYFELGEGLWATQVDLNLHSFSNGTDSGSLAHTMYSYGEDYDSPPPPSYPPILRLECNGSSIKAYELSTHGGTKIQLLSATNSTYTTGNRVGFVNSGDNWYGGDL